MTKSVWKASSGVCPKNTPWGPKQSESIACIVDEQFYFVHTAGHGGLWLTPRQRKALPPLLQAYGATGNAVWWEEDCKACVPLWYLISTKECLSTDFDLTPDEKTFFDICERSVKDWEPDIYEALSGQTLMPEESSSRTEKRYYTENMGKLISRSAWGDWANWVPKGMVGVAAYPAECFIGASPGMQARFFLVPKSEYDARERLGIVIDPTCHQEVSGPSR